MILKLRTVKQIDRALAFLRAERDRRISVQWTAGPVSEQRTLADVGRRSRSSLTRHSREADMRLVLTSTQQCGLSVTAVDKRGNPAQVENVRWDASDPSIATVEADASDPLKASVRAAGPIGTAQINVTGDAQLGDGEVPIAGTLDLEIIAGQAATFTVAADTPQEQGSL